ncbi:hypothetical protein HanHA300_Chr12g0444421 [Helianthus annuus]|nr:hypothetical protein HanHA300_Chr12g0444421 [Helianthus annuus]
MLITITFSVFSGELGCVCNVSFESDCRIIIELAIPCEKPGSRGLKDSQWAIIHGHGKLKSLPLFIAALIRTRVVYMTAVASLSQLVQKPTVTVSPKTGLEVTLSGSAATGSPPTTLSPTLLNIDCRCQTARDDPYEVQLTIPVEGYDPVQFSLTKMCGTSSKGWALFGIFSCIFFVISTLFCCGGFIYKTQHGIDALPGIDHFICMFGDCKLTFSRIGIYVCIYEIQNIVFLIGVLDFNNPKFH